MGETVWLLVGQVIGAAVGSLVGALLVQVATRIVAKFKPPYGMAYRAALFGVLAAMALGFVVGLVAPPPERLLDGINIALFVAGFLIQSFVYGALIKDPSQAALGFHRGVLVALTQLAIVAAFAAVLVGLVHLLRAGG